MPFNQAFAENERHRFARRNTYLNNAQASAVNGALSALFNIMPELGARATPGNDDLAVS